MPNAFAKIRSWLSNSWLARELPKQWRGIKNLRFFQFRDFSHFSKIFSRREKIIFSIFAAVLILDLSLIGTHFYLDHTTPVASAGGTYAEGLVGQPTYLNPLLATSQTDLSIDRLVYAGLYKSDDRGNMVPDLASGPLQISADGKTYTAKLRSGLKWSDGRDLNADDVLYTIQTLQNPNYKSPYQGLWKDIQVKKIDDLTVQFINPDISSPFITNLTIGILPKHIWSQINSSQFLLTKFNLQPIGSGPYFIKEIKKQASGIIQSMTLVSYSNYWAGKPNIDQVAFNFYSSYQDALLALHSKEINSFGFVPSEEKVYIDKNTKLNTIAVPIYQYQALFFNLTKNHNVLGDTAVRSALAQSINRNDLINSVYDGLAVPAYGPIMPGQLGYNPDIQKINAFNLDSANKILDAAGWTKDPKTGIRAKGGQQLAFTITTNDFALNSQSAQNLADQWKKIDANVTVNIVPTTNFAQNYIRTRNFDALLFNESTGLDPDPFIFWHSSQAINPGLNVAQYKNAFADKLISDARNTFDQTKHVADYQQFQTILATDVPAIFLDQSEFVYQTNANLQGVAMKDLANPADRFYDIINWYVQTRRVWKR